MSDKDSPPCPIGAAPFQPYARGTVRSGAKAVGLHASQQPMPKLKTYVVEDSPVIRDNLIATLEELVPVVKVVGIAEDEATAVAVARARRAPRRSGHHRHLPQGRFGAGRARGRKARQPGARLVVLTNYATLDMRRKCLELGADKVFDKSDEIDALIQYCGRMAPGEPINSRPGALG